MSYSFDDFGSSSTAVDASMGDLTWDALINPDMFDGEPSMSPAPSFIAKQDAPSFNERVKRETSLLPQQQMSGPTHNYSEYRQATGVVVDPLALQTTLQATQHTGYNSYGTIDTIPEEQFDFNSPVSQLTPFPSVSPMAPQFSNFPDLSLSASSMMNSGVDTSFGTMRSSSIGSSEPSTPLAQHSQVYPGIHTRQAQFQSHGHKVQQLMDQQRRTQGQQSQDRQFSQPAQPSGARMSTSSQGTSTSTTTRDPAVERAIYQVLHRARTASSVPPTPSVSDEAELNRIAKEAKKEQDEMDEDERLLNSEEGKQLPSTKRRQLRNKVSARHFRLRRKEHIEGLQTENATLKVENEGLRTENAGLTGFVQQLLRAPEFQSYLTRVTREQATQLQNQAVQQQLQQQQQIPQQQMFTQQQQFPQPQQQRMQQNFDMFQDQDLDINLVQAPDVDFSAVLNDKPNMPEPLDLGVLSGKTTNFVGSIEEFDADEEKTEMPTIEQAPAAVDEPVIDDKVDTVIDEEFENDPAFALYQQDVPEPEVVAAELHEESEALAMAELQRRSASLEGVCERLTRMTM